MNASVKKSGFTLLELLIVILIIGLLSAISIPMYKKAVEKSKVADALSTMQAVSKSEHGWYLVKNNYTKDFANLDIDLYDKDGNKAEDESFDSINYTFTLQDNAIKAERNNEEYSLYKLYEDGNIYCLPQDHYICEQYGWGVNKQVCNSINGLWANKTSTCYNTEEERCAGVDMPWAASGAGHKQYAFCGYYNTDQVEIDGFGICGVAVAYGTGCSYSTFTGADVACTDARNTQGDIIYGANNGSCSYSQFNDGAVCDPTGTATCRYSEFNNGSICKGAGTYACNASTFTAGSKCINVDDKLSCGGSTFYEGSECITRNDTVYGGCNDNIFKPGSKCIANNSKACKKLGWGTEGGTTSFETGSYCVGNAENSCAGFKNFQATCVANAPGACAGNTYTGAGCCSGNYCPESAPKCNS